jgi:hypothetical protein
MRGADKEDRRMHSSEREKGKRWSQWKKGTCKRQRLRRAR